MATKEKKSSKTDEMRKQREAAAAAARENEGATPDISSYAAQRQQLLAIHQAELQRKEVELASKFYDDSRKLLDRHIRDSSDSVLKQIWADYAEAAKHFQGQGGGVSSGGGSGKTRKRRSDDEKKADAEKILGHIKAAGKDGIKAADLAEKLKADGISDSPAAFIKEQLGVEIRTEGQRRGAVYFAK